MDERHIVAAGHLFRALLEAGCTRHDSGMSPYVCGFRDEGFNLLDRNLAFVILAFDDSEIVVQPVAKTDRHIELATADFFIPADVCPFTGNTMYGRYKSFEVFPFLVRQIEILSTMLRVTFCCLRS